MELSKIRNFCIISHVDHGKSTLADRFLEFTGTIDKRNMKNQVLDQMDLERERGITIKLAPVTMQYKEYQLNLIDTPGHVDFTYEVSRSLAAVEGAILLVDATQGIQAQTVGNLHLAQAEGLTIIPVLNKVDVQGADIDRHKKELAHLLNISEDEILLASGKTGQGVEALLETVIQHVPAPTQKTNATRALIFDSVYDEYQGVIAYVRVVDGTIRANDMLQFLGTRSQGEALEVGKFAPARKKIGVLEPGEIGYVVTGLKDIGTVRVGDTIAAAANAEPLAGYKEMTPMVFVGLFPQEGSAIEKLREGLEKLALSDAALQFEPERSSALGFGFRVGLLGMLHLEILKERLVREYHIAIVVTVPSVAYQVYLRDGESHIIKSALDLPDSSTIDHIEEPYVRADIVSPKQFQGAIIQLAEERRGIYITTEYIEDRAMIRYELPLASIIVDFYDKLKSVSSGYASFYYELIDYRPADVVRMDILVAEEPVEAFSSLTYRDDAERIGRMILFSLKETIPRQQFETKLQAKVGGKIIAAERISAMRKDVLAKLYGGDVTRKMKLLKKQKEGKKRRQGAGKGSVQIPPEAYLAVLKR